MQYTLRNIPEHLDRALRQRACDQAKSINQVAVEALGQGLGLTEGLRRRDLSDLAGSWRRLPKVERALKDQRRIDADLWS